MFNAIQVIGLTIFTFVVIYDAYHTQLFPYGRAVLCGFASGLIMGDIKTGLLIGGTLELMSLGVGAYGGSSVPNYNVGAIIGTAFAIANGGGIEAGLAVGIPVAAFGVQLDVFAKMMGSFFHKKAMEQAENLNLKKMYQWIAVGALPRVGFLALAVLISLTAGSDLILKLLELMPSWLIKGLNVAGGVLPAVGFAILLRYMPLKKFYYYSIFGFLMASYLKLPMLAIAGFGFVLAVMYFNNSLQNTKMNQQGGDNYDE